MPPLRRFAAIGWVTLLFAALGATAAHSTAHGQETAPDADSYEGRAEAWLATGFTNQVPEGVQVRQNGAIVQAKYSRDMRFGLILRTVTAELRTLKIKLRSKQEGAFVLMLQDRDGARFLHMLRLAADQPTELGLSVTDFISAPDSPTKKDRVDPARLFYGLVLADVAAIQGTGKGENVLEIGRVEVERAPLKIQRGVLLVTQPVEVTESGMRVGDIIVRPGGRITISAPRFVLAGRLIVEGGQVSAAGGTWTFPQRFNHEMGIRVQRGLVSIRESWIVSRVPMSLKIESGGAAELVTTGFDGGVTAEVLAGAKLSVNRTTTPPGEFVLSPGCECQFAGVTGAMLWLTLGENFSRGRLQLPPGAAVADFTPGHGLNVRVVGCADVQWGLMIGAGADGVIERSELAAVGVVFAGDANAKLRELHNGRADDRAVMLKDRAVRFVGTRVRTWNVVAMDHARVSLEKCSIGAALAFDAATIDAFDSFCDGSAGGYLGAHDHGELRFRQFRVGCTVVARNEAAVSLSDCEIEGDTFAADRATLRLIECRGTGQSVIDSAARLQTEWPGPTPVPPNTRPFLMAVTPFPYDDTQAALEQTYKLAQECGDMIAHNLDEGVPWPEALEGRLPESVVGALATRAGMSPRLRKPFVAVSPLNRERDGLALRWGTAPAQPLPAEWKDKDFGDPDVAKAYLNFCRQLIERLQCPALVYAIDANVLARKSPAKWGKFVEFLKTVYSTLKSEYPKMWFAVSLQVEVFFEDEKSQRECVEQILPYTDAIAVSTYPALAGADVSNWTGERLEKMAALAPGKPFGVSETGSMAEPLVTKAFTLAGNEKLQERYLTTLLQVCHRLNAKFVVWTLPRDFDALTKKLRMTEAEAAWSKLWCNNGLFNGAGKIRPAGEAWKLWLRVVRM